MRLARIHTDERATRYCALFDQPGGDTNVFIVKPGQRTCWHRHSSQMDQFVVVGGRIRFGTFWPGESPEYCLLKRGDYIRIEPGFWHGYANTRTDCSAVLLMYLSQKYDPTDEERMSEDEMPWRPT
jgi:quercetin dioxygenase-like cupin family protein